jgi:hypothetical protein
MKLESHLRAKITLITYSNNSYSNTAVATGDLLRRIPDLWYNETGRYKGIDVRSNDKGGSIITLGMQGEIRQEWLSTLIRP